MKRALHECFHVFRPSEIEDRVRRSVKDIIPCNILDERIVSEESGLFDCITTACCLDGVCSDMDTYRKAVKNLSLCLRPGGHVVSFAFPQTDTYSFGEVTFGALKTLTEAEKVAAFTEAGFVNIKVSSKSYTAEEQGTMGYLDASPGVIILCGQKM